MPRVKAQVHAFGKTSTHSRIKSEAGFFRLALYLRTQITRRTDGLIGPLPAGGSAT